MRIPASLFAIALAGCTQQPMPSHVSVSNAADVTDSTATFTQCGMSVRFGGPPRKLTEKENSGFAKLSNFARWEVEGLARESYRLAEVAVCLCADLRLDQATTSEIEKNLKNSRDVRSVKAIELAGSRGFETESAADVNSVMTRTRFLFPWAAPSCLFVESARFSVVAPEGADAFLDSIRPATLR